MGGSQGALDEYYGWTTTKKNCEYILTRFGYPFTLVTNQGVHFINDVIKYLH
jgi:hypothetical protein